MASTASLGIPFKLCSIEIGQGERGPTLHEICIHKSHTPDASSVPLHSVKSVGLLTASGRRRSSSPSPANLHGTSFGRVASGIGVPTDPNFDRPRWK